MLGLVAGLAGTALMTAWQELVQKARSPGDDGGGGGEPSWDDAPAPAQVARRALEPLGFELPPERIPLLTNAMHWGYGAAWGVLYAIALGSRRGAGTRGLAFGTGVWALSYAQLVPLGIYEPPWRYPPQELALDLSYHLVFGVGVAGAYAALDGAA